jgi:hypothetical protein
MRPTASSVQMKRPKPAAQMDASNPDIDAYNRLFEQRGLRGFYHNARFRWLADNLERISGPLRIIEFGCCDGRALDNIDRGRIEHYVGLDANWGGGLDEAREKFGHQSNIEFVEASDPQAIGAYADGSFNVAFSLETIEHIPPRSVAPLLDQLARVTRGDLFISVPVEFGPVFLAKHIGKAVHYGGNQAYEVREVINAALGRTSRVARHEHKGFDYRALARDVEQRFDRVRIEGLPWRWLPPSLSLTAGIIARSRK